MTSGESSFALDSAAIDWRRVGALVVPLGDNRRPMVPWTRYREDRDTYDEDAAKWAGDGLWQRASGIGVLTEFSNLLVVDIDVPFDKAFEHLSDVIGVPVSLDEFPYGVVRTRSGRMHLWFGVPDGEIARNLSASVAEKIGVPGVEIKGRGACVPVPPSKSDGSQYEWVAAPFGDDRQLALRAPHPFIAAIYNRLDVYAAEEARLRQENAAVQERERKEREGRIEKARSAGDRVRLETADEEGERALAYQSKIPTAEEGTRYDVLLALAGRLAAAGFSEKAAWQAMVSFGDRCDPPFTEREMRDGTLDKHLAGIVKPVVRELEDREPAGSTDADDADIEKALRTSAAEATGRDQLGRAAFREELMRALDRFSLGSPAKFVDGAVAVEEPREADNLQGHRLALDPPDPWPHAVDGAALLDEIKQTFTRFLALPDGAAEALSLWTVHAHAHSASDVSPRLAFTSASKRCGKTRGLTVLGALVPKPLSTSSITAPGLFRAVERYKPTVLVDEADTLRLDEHDELRGLLNAGHHRAGAYAIRVVGEDHEARTFSVWAPAAVALIGRLPSTLADRSVEVRMCRRRKDEPVERLRLDRLYGDLEPLRRRAARWAKDHLTALKAADPDMPAGLHDRACDNWRSLVAIADLAGGSWPEVARKVALTVSGSESDDDELGVELLADIRVVFESRCAAVDGDGRITSTSLAAALAQSDSRPWREWKRGGALTSHALARLLKPFGIGPRKMSIHGTSERGYERTVFVDVWSRYDGTGGQRSPDDLGDEVDVAADSTLTLTAKPDDPAEAAKWARADAAYDLTKDEGDTVV